VGVSKFLEREMCAGQCAQTLLGTVGEQAVDCNPHNPTTDVDSSISCIAVGYSSVCA
jgi:hypothetical protein